MSVDDDNGGWGHGPDSGLPQNMLRIYRPEGKAEQAYVKNVPGARHEGRLFLHDKCTGQRTSYDAGHVNALLTAPENPERTKERIVELIPRLSPQQKQWLADGVSPEALEAIRSIDKDTAALLASLKEARSAHAAGVLPLPNSGNFLA